MDISAVIHQLRTFCPALKLVGGAADFARGVETVVNPVNLPAGFVIPDGDDATDNELQNALLQQVRERVQVVVEFDNAADRRGHSAIDQVNAMKYSIFSALLNWRIDPIRAQRGLEYAGCEFIDMDRGRVWYAFRFEQVVSIDDEDGFQETGPELSEIDVEIELGETFTPPTPEPPVTVKVTLHTPLILGGVHALAEAGQLTGFLPPPAITNIGTASQSDNTDVVLAVPAGVPAGSVIVLLVYDSGTAWGSAADEAGNTYSASGAAVGNDPVNGIFNLSLVYDCLSIPELSSITYTPSVDAVGGALLSAFYVENARQDINNTAGLSFGINGTPNAILGAKPEANSVVIGGFASLGPGTDDFIQDSNHPYATPPVRVSYTADGLGDRTIAGGTVINSNQIGYAPTITPRAWAELIVSIAPITE